MIVRNILYVTIQNIAMTETEFQEKYFSEEKDLIPFLRARGLTGGVGGSDRAKIKKYNNDFDEALNDYAVMVNARDRKLTVSQALRNSLIRKIRLDAKDNGFDSKLFGE